MASIRVGDPAPDLVMPTQHGKSIVLRDYRGKHPVVLFFYPKDGTSICTKEACQFRDSYEQFTRAGAVVVGISSDSESRHQKFTEQYQLPYVLVSDRDGSIRRAFGVPKTLGFLPGRVTYVIDREGIVRHIFNSQFAVDRHVEEALEIVQNME